VLWLAALIAIDARNKLLASTALAASRLGAAAAGVARRVWRGNA